MKVLVGLSGGVDSSAAALLLKNEYDVSGVTLSLYNKGEICKKADQNNINDAKKICLSLGIPHTVLNLQNEFYDFVIKKFTEDYISGLTPNPCINCNKYIKFGLMFDYALKNGYEKIATGHYAKVEFSLGKYWLKCAADRTKDQTYVLYNLNEDLLSKLILPLGDYTKEQCRELAEKSGLVTARKSDSQDICFIPTGDYGSFIEEQTGKYPEGDYLDIGGKVLGRHKGIIHYTVGQRKGLGIALGEPAFVIEKNAQNNTVILGKNEDLFSKTVFVRDLNFITEKLKDGEKIEAKLRYSQNAAPAVYKETENGAILEFDSPQRAATNGQSAVFYKDGYCLGGGIIGGTKQ